MKRPIWKAFVVAGLSLALTLMLLPTVVASAEPDHTATLDRANPKFTWESSGTGTSAFGQAPFRCTAAPFKCEYILLGVETAGELTLALDGTDSDPTGEVWSLKDIDGYLYRSNAAGEPLGNTLTKDCATVSSSETCKASVSPGFHVVEIQYFLAVEAHYTGTAELAVAPGPLAPEPQMIGLDECNFTLYYFKDSAERLLALVPPGYRARPYPGSYVASTPLETTEGSATIAAAAYDCDRIEVPGSSPAPAIITVLSVLVYPPNGTEEGAGSSDFYVLWVHANNPQLVELLASRGMPADLVPGMSFEKPLQSLAVRVDVPWSSGAYELATTGVAQDLFHTHDNTYLHVADDRRCRGDGAGPSRRGCLVRMDFGTRRARDHFCTQSSDDHHAVECGKLTAQTGTPVASFFGASDRTADTAWDHEPLERSWFVLQ
jgi:hypothetical protein